MLICDKKEQIQNKVIVCINAIFQLFIWTIKTDVSFEPYSIILFNQRALFLNQDYLKRNAFIINCNL